MNEVARWITLQDPSFAVPLKGAVKRIVDEFGLSAEKAGEVLHDGMVTGDIAVQSADDGSVLTLSPRTMATQIDWANGFYTYSGLPLFSLVLHWPDVERVAKELASGPAMEGALETNVEPALPSQNSAGVALKRRGPKGQKTERAVAAILADLKAGKTTVESLEAEKQESLAALYGVQARSTAIAALRTAKSRFNSDSNSDK